MKKILLTIVTFASTFLFSQNVFQENFAGYTANAQLSGQGVWTNNSSLPGGLGTCVGLGCLNAFVVNQNIAAMGYGSSSKVFSLRPNADGCGRAFPAVTSGDLYVGMVVNITAAQTAPIDFFRVLSGGNFNTSFRVLVQPTGGSTFSVGIRKGDTSNPTVYTTNSYNYGTDYLLIFKYSQGAGVNDDTISLYANADYPAGESGNTVSATNFTGNDQAGNVDRLAFRQNAGPAGMPTGVVGLISVARTWETLTFNLSNNQFSKNTFAISGSNATNGILTVKSNTAVDKATLKIYTVQGSLLETKSISLNETINDIAINPIRSAGIYIIKISTDTNQRYTEKIIIN